jgi:hypothetical protein
MNKGYIFVKAKAKKISEMLIEISEVLKHPSEHHCQNNTEADQRTRYMHFG